MSPVKVVARFLSRRSSIPQGSNLAISVTPKPLRAQEAERSQGEESGIFTLADINRNTDLALLQRRITAWTCLRLRGLNAVLVIRGA